MENNELVPVQSFCIHHKIELSFIDSLQQYGLVDVIVIEKQAYIKESELEEVERFTRLHYDLDINVEGIEAIGHLLAKLREMQARNMQLQNRLKLYEEGQD
ncbi:MAG: chaperone modulator CbpM [Chitinophagaceae bacterium]